MKRAITAALVLCAGASLGMRCFTPAQPILVQVTERLPSAATPAETPGTDGVVVTNPKLLAQFGPDADLNQATYTRYLLSDGMLEQPDAILVTIPGFQGGAAGFEILAENAIRRMRDEQGLVLEVWAFDRRSNQLEDLEGLNIAEVAADPQIGLDWLFGSELGLTLSPELAAGPNRRVVFYNPTDDIPFFANWTPLVHSQDVDAVIEAALAEAKNGNVFLGGHSAGTGFLARYAATDFDLSGVGPAEPGYAKVRGLVLFEGGGGSIGAPPTDDDLDRIEARFDGGLFGAVRDGAPRCIDGATPCAVASEDVDCAAFANTKCTPSTTAYSQLFGLLGAETFAAVEPAALQADLEGDSTQLILAQDQNGIPGNSALQQVPGLGLLVLVLPDATGRGAIGSFLDDDGGVSQAAAFIATSLGAPGPEVNGLVTWLGIDEPLPPSVLPDNGPAPTTLPGGVWGVETEPTDVDRLFRTFYAGDTNFVEWYYPSSGLGVTAGAGGLDTTALSADPPLGRGRRDIANLTEAQNIDVPVIAFGGSNGLTPIPAAFLAFAETLAPCAAPSCDGSTPRVVDASNPNPAFPTYGGVAGGYEVHMSVGYSHVDVLTARDQPGNNVVAPLVDFLVRNLQ